MSTDPPTELEPTPFLAVDIVIDTNVWVHVDNQAVSQHESARSLITRLLHSSTMICFDLDA